MSAPLDEQGISRNNISRKKVKIFFEHRHGPVDDDREAMDLSEPVGISFRRSGGHAGKEQSTERKLCRAALHSRLRFVAPGHPHRMACQRKRSSSIVMAGLVPAIH